MTAVYAHLETTCAKCKRALTSADATTCSRCGAPRLLRIDVPSADLFHLAIAALRSQALVRRHVEPGGALGAFGTAYLGLGADGTIWIDVERREEAAGALAHTGLGLEDGFRPIVDRSDAMCPHCGVPLESAGPTRCEACGGSYEWVDIEEPPFDPTGQVCRACGYELTGAPRDRCPECGEAFGHDADTLVTAIPTPRSSVTDPPPPSRPDALTRAIWVIVGLFLVLLCWEPVVALCVGAVAVVLVVFKAREMRRGGSGQLPD